MRFTAPPHLCTVLIVNSIVYISGKAYLVHLKLCTLMRYHSYVNAPNWATLAQEVLEYSTAGSPFDEMVQLHDAKMGMPRSQASVRRIVYSNVDQIADLLAPNLPAAMQRPQEHDPPDTANEQAGDNLNHPECSTSGEDTADNRRPSLHLDDGSLMLNDEPDAAAIQRAQEKLDSARVIADAYSSYAFRKKDRLSAKMTPADIIHRRYITEYRGAYRWDTSMEEPHKRYRLLLIIPLPYGLTLLELAREHLYERRLRLKKRVNAGDQFDHEHYSSAMTQCK